MRLVLDKLYQNTTTIYFEALSYLSEMQVYFADELESIFLKHARSLSMLRVPQLRLDDVDMVSYKYNLMDIWKVWPDYMDMEYFAKHQVNNVFKEIKLNFFDKAHDILSKIDMELEQHVNDIEISLLSLKSMLDDYAETSKIDERLVV